ncbi:type IV secretory system conjugative DNA transfer family protein [Gordonia jinhuaensis]|uniref:type IV secretory system conjugative DNA transfer family protein n=1 Tax=Gordonia jinhuaensis TaxID=1517702 RepID=UPI001668E47F|nr:TraM recognition domain-containing protein [Gordonia jinhuaensis]
MGIRDISRSAQQRSAPQPADEPYVGMAAKGDPRPRRTGMPHALVTGVTGSGKSRTVLAPAALEWGKRPAVIVSSKADLAGLCAPTRARYGPTYLMDLSGEVDDAELKGAPVIRVASDPIALIHDDDSAMELATLLQEVGPLAAGDSTGGGGDSGFWKSLAQQPLAAILRAAHGYYDVEANEDRDGGGVRWAIDATINSDAPASMASGEDDQDGPPPLDLVTASWDTAVHRLESIGSRHGRALLTAKGRPDEQKASIGINMQVALNSWVMDAVAGSGDLPVFRPEMLEAPGASLFIVSPLTGAAGPAAAATLTAMVNHWRKRVGKLPSLLMIVDELPNTSPLPRLANWIGEARGLGVRIMAAVQATSQFEPRWGSAQLKVLKDVFPQILVLPPGVTEQELLERAAWAAGQAERATTSTDTAGRASQGRDRTNRIDAAELMPPPGYGRLLISGTPGHLVHLPDLDATDLRRA